MLTMLEKIENEKIKTTGQYYGDNINKQSWMKQLQPLTPNKFRIKLNDSIFEYDG